MKTTFLRRSWAVAGCVLATMSAAAAQDAPARRHGFGLQLGAAQAAVSDVNVSPLLYRGRLGQVGLRYRYQGPRGQWQAGAQAAYGSFDAKAYPGRTIRFEDGVLLGLGDNLLLAGAHVQYLRQVYVRGAGRLLLGGRLQQTIQYPFNEPHAGLTAVTSVPLVAGWQQPLGPKTRLEAQAQVALGGLITRLPWDGSVSRPDETSRLRAFYRNNTRFEPGYRLRQAALTLGAERQLTARWSAGVQYQLGVLAHDEPARLVTLTNSLAVQLYFGV